MENKFSTMLSADRVAHAAESGRQLAGLTRLAQKSILFPRLGSIMSQLSENVCLVDDIYIPGYTLNIMGLKGLVEVVGAIYESSLEVKSDEFVEGVVAFLHKLHEAFEAHLTLLQSANIANDVRLPGQAIVDMLEEYLVGLDEIR